MGPNASFMPNEFVKIILIGFIARKIALRKDNPDPGWKDICLNIMLPVIFVVGLIATENLSTAVLLFATCIAMMFVGKIKMKYILSFVGIAVLFLALFICIKFMTGSSGRQTTWKARITNTDNYQKDYAKAAIATGGIFGKLPGKSTERNSLPKVENDCIYAIVVEEYGLVGGVIVLSLYLILLYRVVMIMVKRPDSFGAILSFGLILCIVMQAFINMGVSVGLLPTTGQNLPFVSRGGTSMICTGISFGIILSVTRDINKTMKREKNSNRCRLLISGGGTGGHIFPAIAIADAFKKRHPDAEIMFIGAKGRMEMDMVPKAGYPIEGLWISGFKRSLSLDNLLFPLKLLCSLVKAGKIIRRFNPDLVVGVGGFASGPTMRRAASMKIPVIIQEQNSFPGVTNRMMANKASRICVAYDAMDKWFPAEKIVLTGNPLRNNIMNVNVDRAESAAFSILTLKNL